MAQELQYYGTPGETGETVVARLYEDNTGAQVGIDIPTTEVRPSVYMGDMPSAVAAGTYVVRFYRDGTYFLAQGDIEWADVGVSVPAGATELTARNVVERAFRLINVVAKDEAMEAADAVHGLNTLNRMIHGWKLRGADYGHIGYGLDSEIALGNEHIEALEALLAERLAAEYERPLPAIVTDTARHGWDQIKAAALSQNLNPVKIDAGLRRMPSQYLSASRYRL